MTDAGDRPITRDDVIRIAALSNLSLSAPEVERMTRELGSILAYVRQLQELDVDAVEPTAHVQVEELPVRDDLPFTSLPRELALREAPKTAEGGFAVPAFVDEG